MTKLTQKMKDDHEEFLVEIPMLLEDLQDLLKKSSGYRDVVVAYDDETIDRIERFYGDVLEGKEKVDVSDARLGRIIIAYFGEAVRERAGGIWELNDTEGDPSFGTPVILPARDGVRVSPVELRERFKEDRQPYLRSLIDFLINQDSYFEDLFKDLK